MKTPRKHAELIKAWADGAEIEYREYPDSGNWHVRDIPNWTGTGAYRIKPEPKPDVVEKYKADAGLKYGGIHIAEHWETDNLKLTFDGETGKLKSAEVI
jgi:hypothetical protein